jgi:hypothetical protein
MDNTTLSIIIGSICFAVGVGLGKMTNSSKTNDEVEPDQQPLLSSTVPVNYYDADRATGGTRSKKNKNKKSKRRYLIK